MTVTVEPVPAPTREVEKLLTELDGTLGAAYAPQQRHALSIDRLFQPDVRFYVARLEGDAMGCGGAALFERMYAREPARGRGIGRALLARVEAETRNAGKSLLRLETGIYQAAAIALYEGWGVPAARALRPLRRAPAQCDCHERVLRKAAVAKSWR